MTLPLPMPGPDASEQEWTEYINELTLDELIGVYRYLQKINRGQVKRESVSYNLWGMRENDSCTERQVRI